MRYLLLVNVLLLNISLLAQEPCDVSLSSTPITCPGDADGTLTVEGTGGPYTYLWSHDPSLTSATATNIAPGVYTVIVTDGIGCISELEENVQDPDVPPLGSITTTDITCAGNNDGSLTFTPNSPSYDWEWMHDPAETSPLLTGMGPGTYVVFVTDPPNCPSYIFGELGDPDVLILGDPNYCPSDPPLLTAELAFGFQPHVYEWSTGATTSAIQIDPGMEGAIELTATDTTSGCVATADLFLTELPSPFVEFAVPDSVCEELPFTASTIDTDADSLVWRWAGSSTSNETDAIVTYNEPYWQQISLQGFDIFGCGNAPVVDSIYVHPIKPAYFTVEQIPCSPRVRIELMSDADSCAFFIGDSLVINECWGSYQWDNRRYAIYDHTFIATQRNMCNDTAGVKLDVRTEPTLFLPTAFTPNNDGMNDEWPGPVDISDHGFELHLFDRWGASLWVTKDPMAKWSGADLPAGVYVYTMRMRDPCEPTNEVAKTGQVLLLR